MKNNSFLIVIIFLYTMSMIFMLSNQSSYTPYTDSTSYRTGIPDKKEIHYRTVKTFKMDDDYWAEEDWHWSRTDFDGHDADSFCGHVIWRKYADDPSKPYTAVVFENYSRNWHFATLKESEGFVTQWCK